MKETMAKCSNSKIILTPSVDLNIRHQFLLLKEDRKAILGIEITDREKWVHLFVKLILKLNNDYLQNEELTIYN
jgi:hypothetical protein